MNYDSSSAYAGRNGDTTEQKRRSMGLSVFVIASVTTDNCRSPMARSFDPSSQPDFLSDAPRYLSLTGVMQEQRRSACGVLVNTGVLYRFALRLTLKGSGKIACAIYFEQLHR
jgi:hypothetical protein